MAEDSIHRKVSSSYIYTDITFTIMNLEHIDYILIFNVSFDQSLHLCSGKHFVTVLPLMCAYKKYYCCNSNQAYELWSQASLFETLFFIITYVIYSWHVHIICISPQESVILLHCHFRLYQESPKIQGNNFLKFFSADIIACVSFA